jgi:hypothetical protein
VDDLWDFLADDDSTAAETAGVEATRQPAEIAALHVIVLGAALEVEPDMEDVPVAHFADEDAGVDEPEGDLEEDVGVYLERQHYATP